MRVARHDNRHQERDQWLELGSFCGLRLKIRSYKRYDH
jgi:hypothetical protein